MAASLCLLLFATLFPGVLGAVLGQDLHIYVGIGETAEFPLRNFTNFTDSEMLYLIRVTPHSKIIEQLLNLTAGAPVQNVKINETWQGRLSLLEGPDDIVAELRNVQPKDTGREVYYRYIQNNNRQGPRMYIIFKTRPPAVSSFSITNAGEDYVNITWKQVEPLDSAPVWYHLEYREAGVVSLSDSWEQTNRVPHDHNPNVTTQMIKVEGLSPGTKYQFRVVASNRFGESYSYIEEAGTMEPQKSVGSGLTVGAIVGITVAIILVPAIISGVIYYKRQHCPYIRGITCCGRTFERVPPADPEDPANAVGQLYATLCIQDKEVHLFSLDPNDVRNRELVNKIIEALKSVQPGHSEWTVEVIEFRKGSVIVIVLIKGAQKEMETIKTTLKQAVTRGDLAHIGVDPRYFHTFDHYPETGNLETRSTDGQRQYNQQVVPPLIPTEPALDQKTMLKFKEMSATKEYAAVLEELKNVDQKLFRQCCETINTEIHPPLTKNLTATDFKTIDRYKNVPDNYVAIETTGNGDCLFNAVSMLLTGTEDHAALLRLGAAVYAGLNMENIVKELSAAGLAADDDTALAFVVDACEASVSNQCPFSVGHNNPKGILEYAVMEEARVTSKLGVFSGWLQIKFLSGFVKHNIHLCCEDPGKTQICGYHNVLHTPSVDGDNLPELRIMMVYANEESTLLNHFVGLVKKPKVSGPGANPYYSVAYDDVTRMAEATVKPFLLHSVPDDAMNGSKSEAEHTLQFTGPPTNRNDVENAAFINNLSKTGQEESKTTDSQDSHALLLYEENDPDIDQIREIIKWLQSWGVSLCDPYDSGQYNQMEAFEQSLKKSRHAVVFLTQEVLQNIKENRKAQTTFRMSTFLCKMLNEHVQIGSQQLVPVKLAEGETPLILSNFQMLVPNTKGFKRKLFKSFTKPGGLSERQIQQKASDIKRMCSLKKGEDGTKLVKQLAKNLDIPEEVSDTLEEFGGFRAKLIEVLNCWASRNGEEATEAALDLAIDAAIKQLQSQQNDSSTGHGSEQTSSTEAGAMTRVVKEEDFQEIQEHIGWKWKNVAKRLGLSDGQIDCIEHDHKEEPLSEKVYQMLRKWKQLKGESATVAVLIQALKQGGLHDVADRMQIEK